MIELKFEIGDRPWVLGYREGTQERVPVQVCVDKRYLEQHYHNGRWMQRYGVQQLEGEGLCIGFGTIPEDFEHGGEPVVYPLYNTILHDWDLYPTKESLLETLARLSEGIF